MVIGLVKLVNVSILITFSLVVIKPALADAEFLVSSNEDYAHPHDLILGPNGKFLYVSDVNHHMIRVVDALTLKTVAKIGQDELAAPHDVAFDQQGRLLVADSGNDRVVVYTLNNHQASIVALLEDKLRSPEGVTTDKNGHIYVASTGNHQIVKFNGERLVKRIGDRGDGKTEFIRPHDIELGEDGLLYIGDPGNNRIQVLTTSLGYHSTIKNRKDSYKEPKYLALDGSGWLYIADQHNNKLRILDADRKEVGVISKAGTKSLNYIEGVEVANGYLWISDTYNDRIVAFKWQGK